MTPDAAIVQTQQCIVVICPPLQDGFKLKMEVHFVWAYEIADVVLNNMQPLI